MLLQEGGCNRWGFRLLQEPASRLGPRVLEHEDLAIRRARGGDEDLVAVHKDGRGTAFELEANSLQDVV